MYRSDISTSTYQPSSSGRSPGKSPEVRPQPGGFAGAVASLHVVRPQGRPGRNARAPGGDRLPAGPPVGDLRVPQGPDRPARGVRRPPGAHPGGEERRRGVEPHVSDMRGGERRPRVLRVRPEDAGARPVRDLEDGDGTTPPGSRRARLLRGRGLSLLPVEPPGEDVPGGAGASAPELSTLRLTAAVVAVAVAAVAHGPALVLAVLVALALG